VSNAGESQNWRFQVRTGQVNTISWCPSLVSPLQTYPNVYLSVAAIKSDLKETERIFDLAKLGRLQPRRYGMYCGPYCTGWWIVLCRV
jgi:hypothetical protein